MPIVPKLYPRHIKYLFAMTIVLLSGCAAYYPQAVDIPLIEEKGDLRIDCGGFLAPPVNGEGGTVGGHWTVSYGITNMIAGQIYLGMDLLMRPHIQFAPGLFKGFENKTVVELYSGYGYGVGSWNSDYKRGKNNYHLAFAQFNIGKTGISDANIDYGLGLKGGYIFSNDEIDTFNDIHQKSGPIVEPSVFIRFGSKRVKFYTKVNYLWTKTVSDQYYFPLSISMGVNLHFQL